jgi:hypothetical protein
MVAGFGFDERRALLVVVRGDTDSDAEYEEFMERVKTLDGAAFTQRIAPIFIIQTSPKTPAPSAYWRRRFAEAAAATACADMFAGIVTQSAIQRGVINAIRWLQSRERGATTAFESFDDARRAAERVRNEPLPELGELLIRGRADLTARTSTRASARP